MSATIASVTQVSKRYRLVVHIPVNHRAEYHQPVESAFEFPSQEIQGQFQAYADDYENGVKDLWPEWHEKDTSRNATFSLEETRAWTAETPGAYICHVQFDIVDAIAITDAIVETELEGAELTALLQAAADGAAETWIAGRNFVPLP